MDCFVTTLSHTFEHPKRRIRERYCLGMLRAERPPPMLPHSQPNSKKSRRKKTSHDFKRPTKSCRLM